MNSLTLCYNYLHTNFQNYKSICQYYASRKNTQQRNSHYKCNRSDVCDNLMMVENISNFQGLPRLMYAPFPLSLIG